MEPRTDPSCDGATHNRSFNCKQAATWQIKKPDDQDYIYGACGQHLSQVGTYLLSGEQGELDVKRIKTVER